MSVKSRKCFNQIQHENVDYIAYRYIMHIYS